MKNRESSSSDDQIDTSDELIMDADNGDPLFVDSGQQIKSVVRQCDNRDDRRSLPFPPRQDPGEEVIWEAEASRARINAPKGMYIPSEQIHDSLQVDQNYLVIGTHIDQTLRNKILNWEYVDFARLLPRDRLTREDDHCLEIVSKGGVYILCPHLWPWQHSHIIIC